MQVTRSIFSFNLNNLNPVLFVVFFLFVSLIPSRVNAQGVVTPPAFLDSWSEIKVWLESPLPQERMADKFSVRIDGRITPIASVTGSGEPERDRVLPQTPGRIILAGTIQSALGGKDWDPDGEVTQMKEEKRGVFTLTVLLPGGRYEYKITRGGSWDENYGQDFVRNGKNLALTVPVGGKIVKFWMDFERRQVLNSLENPEEVIAPTTLPPRPAAPKINKYRVASLTLAVPLTPEQITSSVIVMDNQGKTRTVVAREVLSQSAFYYPGADLGSRWSKGQTSFKVWSPVSTSARLLLFTTATGGKPREVPMRRQSAGVWSALVPGDLNGVYYQYAFESYGKRRIAADINCYSASPDSRRSRVIDLKSTNPPGWSPPVGNRPYVTDAIIYELHVRDFTIRPSSGVPADKRGKYAGLAFRGARVPGTNFRTGLDYLTGLGVTDIHLLPVQNFLTSSATEYTWGYATNLFNMPEESYSMTPNDPTGVIREFKGMVNGFHEAGLRVVLDVVYNHTWPPSGEGSAFWQTVPYYYFRTNDRGDLLNESGVGNALNDDRPMVRKFVRDSLLYWLTEYKVDGFRFDLMGMFQRESVLDWAKALRAQRPDVLLYGEPWTGGGPIRFGKGDQRGAGVAVFNDYFRTAFRGDADGSLPGFAMGGKVDENALQKAITGWIDSPGKKDGFTDSPQETINYVSAHDNLTLWDKVVKSLPGASLQIRGSAVRLAAAATLLSQGIPFIEGGTPIGRTKGGNPNSYNAGDIVNGYDWAIAPQFAAIRDYYQGLIRLRKAHPVFRLSSAEEVRRTLRFLPARSLPKNTIAFTLTGVADRSRKTYREYLVILHGGNEWQALSLPAGTWSVLADSMIADATPHDTVTNLLRLQPLTAYVFAR